MNLTYKAIPWWANAYHVYNGEIDPDDRNKNRIGIVNYRSIVINGDVARRVWFAHNVHFFTLKGEFDSRAEAANKIPKGPIHQPAAALAHGYA